MINVQFSGKIDKDNCTCDACNAVGTVLKTRWPATKYHDRVHLTTTYREYWLCYECQMKLLKVLTDARNEQEQPPFPGDDEDDEDNGDEQHHDWDILEP